MTRGTTRQNATSAFVSRVEASDAGIRLVSAAHSTNVITFAIFSYRDADCGSVSSQQCAMTCDFMCLP